MSGWKKWRRCEETNRPFDELSAKRQNWLIRTGCRYVWTAAPVVKARERLYENLAANGMDGEKAVTEKIVKVMMKYFRAFNLIDSRSKIEAELEVVSKEGWS